MEEKTANWFRRQGKTPPEHISHDLTPDDISQRVKNLNPRNWHLKGNQLIADTDMGKLSQNIPPNYIMIGEENGLPKFKKID